MYIENMPIQKTTMNHDVPDIKIPSEYVTEAWNRQCVHMLQHAFRKPMEEGVVTLAEYLEVQDWLMHDDISMDILESGTVPSGHAFVNSMTVTDDENYVSSWLSKANENITDNDDLITEYLTIDLVNFHGHWLITRLKNILTDRFIISYRLFIVTKPDMKNRWKDRLINEESD